MKRSTLHHALGGAVVAAYLTFPLTALATSYRVILPASYAGDSEKLGAELWQFFADTLGPTDSLDMRDGQNKRIVKITIPNDERYKVQKRKKRKFAKELGKINSYLKGLGAQNKQAIGGLNMLSALQGLGDNRINTDETHVLMVGTPVQITQDPAWSMIGQDGKLQVPTDTALLSASYRTPYSVTGRKNLLANTSLHICPTQKLKLSRLENMALRHVWGQWMAGQGGNLVTWSSDLSECMERFGAKVTQAVKLGKPDQSLPPAMVRPVWNEADRVQGTQQAQPDVFNIFFKIGHPTIKGILVYTGVAYKPSNYPHHYDNSWCYFYRIDRKTGVEVRLPVADKDYDKAVVPRTVTDKQLKSVGLSREDFKLARSSCQFPLEGE